MSVPDATHASAQPLVLRLYIAGQLPNSVRAIANLIALCREHFSDRYTIEIVDVLEEPLRPLEDGVLVTPTLVKLSPPPVWKIIGDLSETANVRLAPGAERNAT